MEQGPWRALAEFAGGTVGGALQALVGHPLDLVKTRLQTDPGRYAGAVDCLKQTVRGEGMHGLFMGVSAPLVLNGAMTAIMFSTNGRCKRAVAGARGKDVGKLGFVEQTLAAWMTAPVYCFFLTPVELVKARLQVARTAGTAPPYTGPLSCVRHTLRSEGVRGLFRGFYATTAMRVVGSPCYFVSYQQARTWLTDGGRRQTTASTALVAGGFSGVAFWTVAFPADLIKSRMQTDRTGDGAKTSPLSAARKIYAERGLQGFFRGYMPCLLRAPFANAASFLGVEMTLRAAGQRTAF
eukprot:TRINITY_DN13456_c0_g1_i2.p1 TRINITY_DN13456_c0_g1~~TRINITY_DN13456_c0_g1_i2.p1  ORF type:complete len:314 (+),score=74.60 TRINITY_DN13456_c0_g1_i2:60-944(+)